MKIVAMVLGGLALVTASVATAQERDRRADACEIYVDKLAVVKEVNYRMRNIGVILRFHVDAAKLDGPVAAVQMFSRLISPQLNPSQSWEATSAKAVAGAPDTYDLNLWVFSGDANVGSYDLGREAAFYVETTQGTRYWVNSSNFYVDQNFANHVSWENQFDVLFSLYSPPDLASLRKTAQADGSAAYINPTRCQ